MHWAAHWYLNGAWCNSQVGVGQEKRSQSAKVNSERAILFLKIILPDQHVTHTHTHTHTHARARRIMC